MPDAPPLPDPVSDLWQAASGLQHALTSLQRIEAFTMGALAVKEIVSPPISHFQFNPLAFPQPAIYSLAFRPSASNHPVGHPPAFTHLAFGTSAFNQPAFCRPSFRPPTFHPPAVHPKIIASPKLQGNAECNYFL